MADSPDSNPVASDLEIAGPDPELEALPPPRRPGRSLTLLALALTTLASLTMTFLLLGESRYALRGGSPQDLGDVAKVELASDLNNRWVRAEAVLHSEGALRFRRPIEGDTYRLARAEGREDLWVQMRVPEGMDGPHFVPPSSVVGRLLQLDGAGVRYLALQDLVPNGEQAWLLVDGEAPAGSRWALGLVALFCAFAGFGVLGLYRLTRPIRDS